MVAIADAVLFVDPHGQEHDALVTAVHGTDEYPSINLVFGTLDDALTDQYGRQISRYTSVVHRSKQAAHGMYWAEFDPPDGG